MTSAIDIAFYIISLSNREIGELISNLKLQKLLYYAQGIHLAGFDAPLFEEEIEAWSYGPVVPAVYRNFKHYGSNPIFINAQSYAHDLTDEQIRFLDNVYCYYGQYSATRLMQMTHDELPWKSTTISEQISKEKIKKFFLEQPETRNILFPTPEQQLQNAAMLLLNHYENNGEAADFTMVDIDKFHEI